MMINYDDYFSDLGFGSPYFDAKENVSTSRPFWTK
jgi:hypothetical protein